MHIFHSMWLCFLNFIYMCLHILFLFFFLFVTDLASKTLQPVTSLQTLFASFATRTLDGTLCHRIVRQKYVSKNVFLWNFLTFEISFLDYIYLKFLIEICMKYQSPRMCCVWKCLFFIHMCIFLICTDLILIIVAITCPYLFIYKQGDKNFYSVGVVLIF